MWHFVGTKSNEEQQKAKKVQMETRLYYSIPFEYEDGKSLLKVEGNFKVFRHENKEGIRYSLAIETDDKNEEFFT